MRRLLPLLIPLLLLLNGCAPLELRQALEGQKPTMELQQARLTGLNFDHLNMAFDLQIDNPNPVAISLAGLDYQLKLAGKPFLRGDQPRRLRINANASSHITLPLDIAFASLYQEIRQLKGKDTVPYTMALGLKIDVPLLGQMRYPLKVAGTLPLPRAPQITLHDLRLQQLSFNSAALQLTLEVRNPNTFALALQRLNYRFDVNGKRWVHGIQDGLGKLPQNDKGLITLPIHLNFMEVGTAIYHSLRTGKELKYHLEGSLEGLGDTPLIDKFTLPVERRGMVKLSP